MKQQEKKAQPLVRYRDETPAADCPYGQAQRVVTGGDGGVANVHVIRVTRGTEHFHRAYHEVYYVLSGTGTLEMDDKHFPLRPGAVTVIPAGMPHSLTADPGEELEFIIFGTPPMAIDDDRARPRKTEPQAD